MWVAVFILFINSSYQIVALPHIYPSHEVCKMAENNYGLKLSLDPPEGAFFRSTCVQMPTEVGASLGATHLEDDKTL